MSQGQQETDRESGGGAPQPDPRTGRLAAIARYFDFAGARVNFRTEILAGLTTFMTMAYVMVVHPAILSDAIFLSEPGDLFRELAVVTGISTALGSALMGLLANYPFALAPGMGTNAFFAYSVVLGLGIDWRLALGCVLLEGLIFIGLTVTDVRRQIAIAVPDCIKSATTVGIGLFLAYLGLGSSTATGGAGLIVANEVTKTAFGDFNQPQTLLAAFGIFLSLGFVLRRIRGGLLWGIVGTAGLGWALGVAPLPSAIAAVPQFPSDLVGQAFAGLAELRVGNLLDFLAVALVLLFVDLFDTIGTLVGVGTQAGYLNDRGELERGNQALLTDAIATTAGAVLGTSTVTTYAESAAGVAEGGRTGFTAIVVAGLFAVSIFFVPLLEAIPAFATAPALTLVGLMMMRSVRDIRWDDLTEAAPAFATLFFIPFGFSIAAGLSAGLVLYPFVKLVRGRAAEVSVVTWVLAGVFVFRFAFEAIRFGGAA